MSRSLFPGLVLFSVILAGLLWGMPPRSHSAPMPLHQVWVLPLTGAVSPPMADYLHRWFKRAKADSPALVILQIDTPGGLSWPCGQSSRTFSYLPSLLSDMLPPAVPGPPAPGPISSMPAPWRQWPREQMSARPLPSRSEAPFPFFPSNRKPIVLAGRIASLPARLKSGRFKMMPSPQSGAWLK